MKKLRSSMILFYVLVLTACVAGSGFVKPAEDKLVMGKSDKKQIIAMMGEPTGTGEKVMNGEALDIINYAYASFGADAVYDGVTAERSMAFMFYKGKLVGKEFTSSFNVDNTAFYPAKAKSVKKGMKESEVLALMGKPGGEYRYPVIEDKNGKAMVYLFTQTKGFRSQSNMLKVELDSKGTTVNSEYTKVGNVD